MSPVDLKSSDQPRKRGTSSLLITQAEQSWVALPDSWYLSPSFAKKDEISRSK